MQSVIILLALVGGLAASPLGHGGRIVNGSDANLGEFPYIVSLRISTFHICGGSILNEDYILTAAHCVYKISAPLLSVQYGVVKISRFGNNVIRVKSIKYHEEYNATTVFNDIAVLKLALPIPLDGVNVKPVILPVPGFPTPAEAPALLAGWGRPYTDGPKINHLQKVGIKIYSDDDCEAAHVGKTYREYNICAGIPEGGKGQCSGDSGGPLTVNGVHLGIVSWSKKPCAIKGYPGVFCKVGKYIDWISNNTNL